jgi:hypothetical protein
MKTRNHTHFSLSAFAGLALAVTSANAATIQVDIGRTGTTDLQSGWQEWSTDGNAFNTTGESTTFGYADTTGGTLSASLNTTTGAGARNYGIDGVSDPGNLGLQSVWSDLFFFNNNTAGSMTLTLGNLKAGTYEITTYHFADNLAGGSNDDLGIADISVNTVDTGLNATMVGTFNNAEPKTAAQVEASLATFQFTVANDGDAVNILYNGLAGNGGGDSFGINGFELSQIPEPSSTALLGLSALVLLRRRRK